MNIVEKFKSLPDANQVPDEVWDVQKLLDQLAALEQQKAAMLRDLGEAKARMSKALLRDWTADEINSAMGGDFLRSPIDDIHAAISGLKDAFGDYLAKRSEQSTERWIGGAL